VKQVYHMCNRW